MTHSRIPSLRATATLALPKPFWFNLRRQKRFNSGSRRTACAPASPQVHGALLASVPFCPKFYNSLGPNSNWLVVGVTSPSHLQPQNGLASRRLVANKKLTIAFSMPSALPVICSLIRRFSIICEQKPRLPDGLALDAVGLRCRMQRRR
jgi:hypothetical protein